MNFKKINIIDKDWKSNLLIYSGIFAFAVSVRFWFAFCDGHSIIFSACDASEYIVNAKRIQEFCHKPLEFWLDSIKYQIGLLTPSAMSSLKDQYQPLLEISNRSGVIYPLFLAISFWLFQVDINSTELFGPVVMQCLLSSLVCLMTVYLGTKLWNRKVGIIAGLICTIYPGFIVNSTRLVSESFAGFWFLLSLVLAVKMIVEKKGSGLGGFALGLCLGIMQLARSAMVLVTGVIFVCGLASIKFPKAKRTVFLALIGLAIVLGSFACFQNLVTGSPSLVVDRLSNYNLFTGLDLDSHGWLSYPYPNYALMESSSYYEIIKSKFDQGPARFIQLLFDKPPRLIGFPWNDFKTPIGYFSLSSQVLFHQVCLLLAAIGFCLGLVHTSSNNELQTSLFAARCLVVLTFLTHFAYCAFITLPRYALSAMPCLILFSAAGLSIVLSRMKSKTERKQAMLLLAGLLALLISTKVNLLGIILMISPFKQPVLGFVFITIIKTVGTLIFFAALYIMAMKTTEFKKATKALTVVLGIITACFTIPPLYAYGQVFEWSTTLNDSNRWLEQKIQLPKSSDLEKNKYFLLIDSKNWQTLAQATQISINEKDLEQPIIPVMPYVQYGKPGLQKTNNAITYDLEYITSNISNAVGGTNLDLRQWFMVPIPGQVISECLTSNSGILTVKLQNQKNRQATFYGSYITRKNQVIIPGITNYSFEKGFYGIESDTALSDMRFVAKFPIDQVGNPTGDLSNSPGLQTGSYNIRVLEIENTDRNEILVPISESSSEELSNTNLETTLNIKTESKIEDGATFLAYVKGNIQSNQKGKQRIPVYVKALVRGLDATNNQLTYNSPWVPSKFNLVQGDNPIKFSFPVNPADFGKSLDSITVSITPGGPSDSTQFLGIKSSNPESLSAPMPRWTDLSIKVGKMKNWQVTKNFELY